MITSTLYRRLNLKGRHKYRTDRYLIFLRTQRQLMGLTQDPEPDEWIFVIGMILFDAESECIYGAPSEHGGDGDGVV